MLNVIGIAGATAAILGIWLLACDRHNEFIGPFLIGGIGCLAICLIF